MKNKILRKPFFTILFKFYSVLSINTQISLGNELAKAYIASILVFGNEKKQQLFILRLIIKNHLFFINKSK